MGRNPARRLSSFLLRLGLALNLVGSPHRATISARVTAKLTAPGFSAFLIARVDPNNFLVTGITSVRNNNGFPLSGCSTTEPVPII